MTEYNIREKYDPAMTESESDERTASWNNLLSTLEQWISESYEFKMNITTDNYECSDCDEAEAKITVTKRADDEHALHVRAKCQDCETVDDYYVYIA